MNRKQFMGIVTVSLIVGGTIYFIKKHLEAQEAEAPITVEEARALVKLREVIAEHGDSDFETFDDNNEELYQGMSSDEINELVDEARDEVSWNASFGIYNQKEDYDFYDGLDYTRPLSEYITEEDKELRFNPNSIQARDHFIKMELAELAPNLQEYQIMKRLFDFPFEPLNDGDNTLYSQLFDHRAEFFGDDSKWNDNVSIGDIITHYARITDFEIGEGVGHWIIHFVHHTDFSEIASTSNFNDIIILLNRHKFINPRTNTYNIFGLSIDEYLDALAMAEETIDGELTYDIEFNTFLKNV